MGRGNAAQRLCREAAAQGLSGQGRLILLSPGDLVRRILSLIPMDKLDNVEIVDAE